MKKTVSLDCAMIKAARRQKAFGDGRSFRDSKFAKFMLGDAKHYGVHMIHVAD